MKKVNMLGLSDSRDHLHSGGDFDFEVEDDV